MLDVHCRCLLSFVRKASISAACCATCNMHYDQHAMFQLNSYMRILTQHAVDPELVKQIFRQLYYFMCAGALNNLLLRKDMCNWSKGMQIR